MFFTNKKERCMNTKLEFFVFLILCVLTVSPLFPQSNFKNLFPQQTNILEKEINLNIREVHSIKNNTLLLVQENPETDLTCKLLFLNELGEEITTKSYIGISSISTSLDGKRVLVPFIRDLSTEQRTHRVYYDADILDNNSAQVSRIKDLSTPHITISNDGNYVATTRNGGGDESGRFKLFNVINETEIDISLKYKYDYFFAEFLHNEKIAIIIQPVSEILRDIPTGKITGYNKKRARLLIYDLTTEVLTKDKELYSSNQNSVWVSMSSGMMAASDDGKYIAVAGNNLPFNKKKASSPYYLMLMNNDGSLIWEKSYNQENNRFEGVRKLKFLNSEHLIVEKFGLVNSELYLHNLNNNNENWRFLLAPKYNFFLKSATINENNNLILVGSENGAWRFEAESGRLIEKSTDVKLMDIKMENQVLIIDVNNKLHKISK